ncbi:MAG: carboxypeptidase regulatory-like domain-containing protein [Vicinamibacterales bacterium]
MRNRLIGLAVAAVCALMSPMGAFAQSATSAAIAGVAKDTTGAVLPGVTVEAASPALIEKVRSVITDDSGNYKILDLRPGTYSVTFTLPGFGTYKRDALELTTGVTVNVNAEMKVGSLEETVTVTGATPVVDIQNVRSQTVLSQTTLDAIPSAKTAAAFAGLTLGASMQAANAQDVGGNKGDAVSAISIHGGRSNDSLFKIDGMRFGNNSGDGGGVNKIYFTNVAAIQETTLETAGMSAEADTGGVQVNYVPKEGGNAFKYYLAGNFANNAMQSTNLSAEHKARGLTTASSIDKIYDIGGGVGGPIKKDKIWFYTAHRTWGTQEFQPGAFFNKSANPLFYDADTSKPAYTDTYIRDHSVRITWQLSQKNKIAWYESTQKNCFCYLGVSSAASPEAVTTLHFDPLYLSQVTWSNPASNRLLLDAGVSYSFNAKKSPIPGEEGGLVKADAISITDQGLGITYGAFATTGSTAYNLTKRGQEGNQMNGRVSMSYVTGSHAFKGGLMFYRGWDHQDRTVNQLLSYTFRNRVPISLTQWAMPVLTDNLMLGLGYYAQDQWTMGRLTVTGGVRLDTFNGNAPAVTLEASRFLPARSFPAVTDAPKWKDVSPRVGVAYDVFGNGRTAVKGSIGRYVQAMGVGITEQMNPQLSVALNSTRTWSDTNGNLVPDCDLTPTSGANGECGALADRLFGTVQAQRTFAADVVNGNQIRSYNMQASVSVQQELRPGMALNVGYFRTSFGNFSITDNTLVTPANYDSFCVTAPTDARLPGGGGNQLCGLQDVNPTRFGQRNNVVTQSSKFGDYKVYFNGVDAAVNARFGKGGVFNGGVSFGQNVTDACGITIDAPGLLPGNTTAPGFALLDGREGFCKNVQPWLKGGTQLKFNAIYPLPFGFQAAATVQNLPGIPVSANNTFTNAQVLPSLGRNLSAGAAGTVVVPILTPNTLFEDRLNQVDVRFSRRINVGRAKIQAQFDVYNIFNAGTILSVNGTFGAAWLRPTSILGPRVMKFGTVIDF